MFFLLRMAFWLGLVLLLLPSNAGSPAPLANAVGAADAISAVSAAVEDVRGFCTRQPNACTVGARVATSIAYKAQAAAKMLYDALNEALASRASGSLASAPAGVVDKFPVEDGSQSTLRPADLVPPWRGPPRRDRGPSA